MEDEYSSESDCKKNFGMTKHEFDPLVEQLSEFISPHPDSPRAGISAAKKVCCLFCHFLKEIIP